MTRPNLDRLRAIQTAALDLRGSLERETKTPDGGGGYTSAWAVVQNLPCSLGAPRSESERVLAGKVASTAGLMLTLPYDAPAVSGDRFRIGTRVYPILYVEQGQSYQTALRCVVEG